MSRRIDFKSSNTAVVSRQRSFVLKTDYTFNPRGRQWPRIYLLRK